MTQVLTNPHMLLVTLLLCNSAAMEVNLCSAWQPALHSDPACCP